MKYGLVLPNFGSLGDSRVLAELAHIADAAGWDGVFLCDTIQMDGTEASPASDPWIDLAGLAMCTERIRIGLLVAALSRYRPWQLARQAATLDHLSNGRLTLGVGAGDAHDRGFAAFGEEMDLRRRGAALDESLEIFQGLWSGQPFEYHGEHYRIDEITLLPAPVQTPRVPIWVGWRWPNARPMEVPVSATPSLERHARCMAGRSLVSMPLAGSPGWCSANVYTPRGRELRCGVFAC